MSFIGAVAAAVRQVLARYAADVSLPCLIIGAGNFTVPSVLRSGGYAGPITACDSEPISAAGLWTWPKARSALPTSRGCSGRKILSIWPHPSAFSSICAKSGREKTPFNAA